MSGNLYLTTAEFPAYALADSTDPALIAVASDLVDSYCQRTSLLVTQYTERNHLPQGASVTRVTYTPLVVPQGQQTPFGQLRARYGRPSAPNSGLFPEIIVPMSGPSQWVALDPTQVDYNAASGEVWLPAGNFGLPWTEVELTYNAGYSTPPEAAKLACAQIIRNIESHPAVCVRGAQLDRLQLEYFAASLLDEDTRRLLAPFVAVRFN
jgi:hypothetical protein